MEVFKKYIGLAYCIVGIFCFTAQSYVVKYAQTTHTDIQFYTQIILSRFAFNVIHLCATQARFDDPPPSLVLNTMKLQLASIGGYVTLFTSLQYLGVGISMMLQNLSPFIVSIMQYLYLRERIHFYEFMNMLLCFAILFVLTFQNTIGSSAFIGYLLGMASVASFALTYVVPK